MGAVRLSSEEQGSPTCNGALDNLLGAEGHGPDYMYLVSQKWWSAWEAYSAQERLGGLRTAVHPGPVDNSSLLAEEPLGDGEPVLIEGLKEGIDYRVLGQEVSGASMGYERGPFAQIVSTTSINPPPPLPT